MSKWKCFMDTIVTCWSLCNPMKSMKWAFYFEQCLWREFQICIHASLSMYSFFLPASEKGDKSQNMWLSNSKAKRGCSLINPPTYWGIMRDMPFWFLLLIIIEQSVLKFSNKYQNHGLPRTNDSMLIPYSIPNKKDDWKKRCKDRAVRKSKPRQIGAIGKNNEVIKNPSKR